MKTLLLLILCFVLLTPSARPNSAGSYLGGVCVETRLTVTPVHITLDARITKGSDTSPWTPVTADPSGDGKDVYGSPEITVGSSTFRWKNGRLQEKTPTGWKTKRKLKSKGGNPTASGKLWGPSNNIGTVPYTWP